MKSENISNSDQNNLQKILTKNRMCDICIGRIITLDDSIEKFQQNGKNIRKTYTNKNEVPSRLCELCEGITDELDIYLELILDVFNEYEFTSFILGFHVDQEILQKEQEVLSLFSTKKIIPIKNFLKKTVGTIVEKKSKRKVSFDNADMMIIVNTMFDIIELQIKPLYVYGRYNKYKRGIPQTKWFCRQCSGIGCRSCNYTGSLYENSVEELIAETFLTYTKGDSWSFHGAGREDIDVRMLGSGRPFVIEILNPRVRSIDLERIIREVNSKNYNLISISNIRFSNKNEIKRIKKSAFKKVYKVTFKGEKPFDTEKLKKVALTLRGTIIQQFTPTRVARRRANKVRARKIYDCSVTYIKQNRTEFKIETDSGTYIKELVTGDNGKTKPNISELIDQSCQVLTLDVIEIKGE
jgi:tRNA pseudouridine synthase 10